MLCFISSIKRKENKKNAILYKNNSETCKLNQKLKRINIFDNR